MSQPEKWACVSIDLLPPLQKLANRK